MNMDLELQHPWQTGPVELISYAISHLNGATDFERRLAFLLLDVGVETLFKTYLTLPHKATGAQGSYTERKTAAEGNFHELVAGVEKAAQNRIREINLNHVQYFHDLRNKLYHQGNGITVSFDQVYQYAKLSVSLLNILLGVDLNYLLLQPQQEAENKNHLQAQAALQEQEIESQRIAIAEMRQKLEVLARNTVELINYRLVLPSFEFYFNQLADALQHKYLQPGGFIGDGWTFEFINELSYYLENELCLTRAADSLKKVLAISDNITEFYLFILEFTVDNPDGRNCRGIYAVSGLYPTNAELPILRIVGGDPLRPATEYIFPTHDEIIQDGKVWIEDLDHICTCIEKWREKQRTN